MEHCVIYNTAVSKNGDTKTLGIIQVDEPVWKHLTKAELAEIEAICDEKLENYYARFQR